MRRHPSLAPLSREHHGALILAKLLQKGAPPYKGLPADIAGKSGYAWQFYERALIKHFGEEEKIFSLVTGIHAGIDLRIHAVLHEHQELHVLFSSLKDAPVSADQLDGLGRALELHIRKEERELFPMIQEYCSEEIMNEIGRCLSPQP